MFCNPRGVVIRQQPLERAAAAAMEIAVEGYDISVPCEKNVHRAPPKCAAIARKLLASRARLV